MRYDASTQWVDRPSRTPEQKRARRAFERQFQWHMEYGRDDDPFWQKLTPNTLHYADPVTGDMQPVDDDIYHPHSVAWKDARLYGIFGDPDGEHIRVQGTFFKHGVPSSKKPRFLIDHLLPRNKKLYPALHEELKRLGAQRVTVAPQPKPLGIPWTGPQIRNASSEGETEAEQIQRMGAVTRRNALESQEKSMKNSPFPFALYPHEAGLMKAMGQRLRREMQGWNRGEAQSRKTLDDLPSGTLYPIEGTKSVHGVFGPDRSMYVKLTNRPSMTSTKNYLRGTPRPDGDIDFARETVHDPSSHWHWDWAHTKPKGKASVLDPEWRKEFFGALENIGAKSLSFDPASGEGAANRAALFQRLLDKFHASTGGTSARDSMPKLRMEHLQSVFDPAEKSMRHLQKGDTTRFVEPTVPEPSFEPTSDTRGNVIELRNFLLQTAAKHREQNFPDSPPTGTSLRRPPLERYGTGERAGLSQLASPAWMQDKTSLLTVPKGSELSDRNDSVPQLHTFYGGRGTKFPRVVLPSPPSWPEPEPTADTGPHDVVFHGTPTLSWRHPKDFNILYSQRPLDYDGFYVTPHADKAANYLGRWMPQDTPAIHELALPKNLRIFHSTAITGGITDKAIQLAFDRKIIPELKWSAWTALPKDRRSKLYQEALKSFGYSSFSNEEITRMGHYIKDVAGKLGIRPSRAFSLFMTDMTGPAWGGLGIPQPNTTPRSSKERDSMAYRDQLQRQGQQDQLRLDRYESEATLRSMYPRMYPDQTVSHPDSRYRRSIERIFNEQSLQRLLNGRVFRGLSVENRRKLLKSIVWDISRGAMAVAGYDGVSYATPEEMTDPSFSPEHWKREITIFPHAVHRLKPLRIHRISSPEHAQYVADLLSRRQFPERFRRDPAYRTRITVN